MKKSVVTAVVIVICLVVVAVSLPNDVYCPVASFNTQGVEVDVYLKLDNSNQPEYLEFRRLNYNKHYFFRKTRVLFRAYGAEAVKMQLDFKGVEFALFKNPHQETPDTVLVVDVDRKTDYFEVDLRK